MDNIEITAHSIPGVFVFKPRIFGDSRGFFMETFRQTMIEETGWGGTFVQDNLSRSRAGVLRGLHYQRTNPQAKLVTVLSGEVLDVFVDLRLASPTFGQWGSVVLNDENRWSLLVPEGFAHGFAVRSATADFYYKCSNYYLPQAERGIRWDDPDLKIAWDVETPTVSSKDQHLPLLRDIPMFDLFNE
jgi:dTDP-4-dehydrorhamnose 3,5-epimerase